MNTHIENDQEIVLIYPFWSQSGDLNKDSNYSFITTVLKELLAKTDWLFLMLFPDDTHGSFKYFADDFFHHERVLRVPYPFPSSMTACIRHFDANRFAAIEEEFGPTIYWMNQVESANQAADPVSTTADKRPFILGQQHFIIHKSLGVPLTGLRNRLFLQLIGALASDKVLLNSDHTLRMMIDSYTPYLSEDELLRLVQKSEVLKFGLVEDDLPKLRDVEKPVIVYNHRTEYYKKPERTAAVLKELKNRGFEFELWMTQQAQKTDKITPDRFVGHPDRKEYLNRIAVKAINTINSVHETFCISMLDSIALGHLVVVPDSVTFPELVPPDYPFKFKTTEQQTEMLAAIMFDYDAMFEKYSESLRRHARAHFSLDRYSDKLLDVMREGGQRWTSTEYEPATVEKLEAAGDMIAPGSYRFKQFAKWIRSGTGLGRQIMPARRIIRYYQHLGLRVRFHREDLVVDWKKS